MAEPILDYESFFNGAKGALIELDTLSTEEQRLTLEENRITKAIEAEDKATSDRIAAITAKRLKEITSTYDEELKKAENRLSAARQKKEKAKSAGVKQRITDETRELREHIALTRSNIREEMKRDGIARFCNTGLFYTFYFPLNFTVFVKILIAMLVFFLCIPVVIYIFLLPNHTALTLAVIYFLLVFIVGGIYIVLGNTTKARHRTSLIKIRGMRDEIDSDRKRIKLITKDINNDISEEKYDLAAFDEEICAAEAKRVEINAKKSAAINEFENNTKKIITEEILESAGPRIEALKDELSITRQSLTGIAARRSEINLSVSDKYEVYLGKELLEVEKIEALQKIINEGNAVNLSEAIDKYQNHFDE